MPSGQLDESVQTIVWTSIIVTEIHAIRRGLVLMQDRAHLATISRALMIKLKDGPNGQTCAEDDCVGSPCGQGGRCTDLWSFGGPEGSSSVSAAKAMNKRRQTRESQRALALLPPASCEYFDCDQGR